MNADSLCRGLGIAALGVLMVILAVRVGVTAADLPDLAPGWQIRALADHTPGCGYLEDGTDLAQMAEIARRRQCLPIDRN
jgi:hypothetical protein